MPAEGGLPRLADVSVSWPSHTVPDVRAAVRSTLDPEGLRGKRIAVLVGSRGIANIAAIVAEACAVFRAAGAEPFLVPAMGSHAGGTAEGQRQMLADLGLDEDRTGVPVRSGLATEHVGDTEEGIPVHLDATALAADLCYVIGRVKPHTSFAGDLQSGLVKLLVVGGGKIDGARTFHRAVLRFPHSRVLESMFRVLLGRARLLGGLALVEDAHHETAIVEHVPARAILDRERELLREAAALMPALPVGELDVLVVDEIGKNISGAGMDPAITGRRFQINTRWQEERPRITRIVALDLTDESHGNAVGVGLADFAGPRLVGKMDRRATYLNTLTSLNTVTAHLPLCFPTDRETVERAIQSVGLDEAAGARVRLLHIRNTLELGSFAASEALLPELRERPGVRVAGRTYPMPFGPDGGLEFRAGRGTATGAARADG